MVKIETKSRVIIPRKATQPQILWVKRSSRRWVIRSAAALRPCRAR